MAERPTVHGAGERTERAESEPRMFTLMELAQETGIAMPILLRYKREHPDRIPSTGSGAQQRFPEEAFSIFEQIHDSESRKRDLPRRGGFGLLSLPRVRRSRTEPETRATSEAAARSAPGAPTGGAKDDPAAPAPPPEAVDLSAVHGSGETADDGAVDAAPLETGDSSARPTSEPEPGPETETSEATLTMKDVAETLGIAYPTIARYVSKHRERIPHEGEGRQRRFPPEAIAVFRQIRRESKPGRPPKSRARSRSERQRPPSPASGSPGPPPSARSTRSDTELVHRIEMLERRQKELEAMVRDLRTELERPVTAIVEPL